MSESGVSGDAMLEARGLSRRFDGNCVLKNVGLAIGGGEVYGTIGTNGSGKSIFMNTLNGSDAIIRTGSYKGEILIDGRRVWTEGHRQSVSKGIVMVHQELALFAGVSVAENIKVNREYVEIKGPILSELEYVDHKKNREDARKALIRIGADLDPTRLIDSLSLNQKQFVKLVRRSDDQDARLLMLGEPTSSPNITETKSLLTYIQKIATSGIPVLSISRGLEKTMEVCDTISILRDGELIPTYSREEFGCHYFTDDMVRQEIVKICSHRKWEKGETIFCYGNIRGMENDLGIHEGEVLGIIGLAGQSQGQLLEELFGLRATDYQAYFKGSQITRGDNRNLIKNGIYHLPEGRSSHGLFPDSPMWEDMAFGTKGRHPEFLSLRH